MTSSLRGVGGEPTLQGEPTRARLHPSWSMARRASHPRREDVSFLPTLSRRSGSAAHPRRLRRGRAELHEPSVEPRRELQCRGRVPTLASDGGVALVVDPDTYRRIPSAIRVGRGILRAADRGGLAVGRGRGVLGIGGSGFPANSGIVLPIRGWDSARSRSPRPTQRHLPHRDRSPRSPRAPVSAC